MDKEKAKSNVSSNIERQAIKDCPVSERPREKLLHFGPEGLLDGELLAVLLRIGKSGQSAEDLARQFMYLYLRLLKSLTRLRQKLPQFSEMPVHRSKMK